MTQKLKTIIFATALTALAACSDDVATGRYSVGEEDNLVRLTTGVENAPSAAMQSRAALDGHYALQDSTAINLYVEGDWKGKTPSNIVKTPVYSAQKDTDADNINALTWKSGDHLYWDDFGTADPDNTANRAKGLGILAVAIDGVKSATSVNLGSAIDWNLADHTGTIEVGGTKFLKQDILVANNLYDASETTSQKRYTFDEQKALATKPEEARLEFQHVLSKITFNVTPGEGFQPNSITGRVQFYDLNITLARNKANEAENNWCLTNGTIDIKKAEAKHDEAETKKPLTLSTISNTPTTLNPNILTTTEAAVIYPGSILGNNDGDIVARIVADWGNIYYVTAKEIRAAINGTTGYVGDYATKPGYNYIFNITLNKTDIIVTATVSKWIDVNAAEETPKIVVSANVGDKGNTEQTLSEFRFYRNEGVNVPLFGTSDPVPTAPTTKNVKYTALADAKNPATGSVADGATKWDFYQTGTSTPTQLYWPSHTMHYFFRGVYPKETIIAADADEGSYIAVTNAAYDASAFPSNLMIGAPEITDGTNCNNPDHTAVDMSKYGICARTGKINLNFRYMMSQVEVILNTTSGADKVELNDLTKLELTNTICSRNIYLGTRAIGNEPGITRQPSYTMNMKGTATAEQVTFHDAIVPQQLKFNSAGDSDNMRFKVTITNTNGTPETTDDTYDVYYADIKPIQVGGSVISNWVSGTHYKYELTLKKTGLSVTATITDWTTITGSDDIWF